MHAWAGIGAMRGCIIGRRTEQGGAGMLSSRRQRVLEALIEEYVAYAQPVGSRTLVDRYELGVSPATVRNELSVLEGEGYLRSPHTSSGRIPTDIGYRALVDDLLKREYGEEALLPVFDELRHAAAEADGLMDKVSEALSHLTDSLSVVLAPSVIGARVKQVSLVSMSARCALVVVVTDDGQVFNRSVDFASDVDAGDLAAVQNAINAAIAGRSVVDMKASAPTGSGVLSGALGRTILDEIVVCLHQEDSARLHSLGLSSLLRKPEFSRTSFALPLLQVFEDDTVLMRLFDRSDALDDVSVSIGSENGDEAFSGVSVVAAPYGSGPSQGIVAVIGPTRMNYSNVIKAVRSAKRALQDL